MVHKLPQDGKYFGDLQDVLQDLKPENELGTPIVDPLKEPTELDLDELPEELRDSSSDGLDLDVLPELEMI